MSLSRESVERGGGHLGRGIRRGISCSFIFRVSSPGLRIDERELSAYFRLPCSSPFSHGINGDAIVFSAYSASRIIVEILSFVS